MKKYGVNNMKNKKMILVVVLAVVVVILVAVLINLEKEKPENFLEYMEGNPEVAEIVETYIKEPVLDDRYLSVMVEEEAVTYTLDLGETPDYIMVQLEDKFEKFGKDMEKPFGELMDVLEEKSGFRLKVNLVITEGEEEEQEEVFKKVYK